MPGSNTKGILLKEFYKYIFSSPFVRSARCENIVNYFMRCETVLYEIK